MQSGCCSENLPSEIPYDVESFLRNSLWGWTVPFHNGNLPSVKLFSSLFFLLPQSWGSSCQTAPGGEGGGSKPGDQPPVGASGPCTDSVEQDRPAVQCSTWTS